MYVCVCYGVTEKQVTEAVEQGADTLKALQKKLNVGTECGKCIKATLEMMEQTKDLTPNYYQVA